VGRVAAAARGDGVRMIRVTVELLPKGDESQKRHLGTALIANDGTGSEREGNYNVQLSKWGEPGIAWKKGRVEGFPRKGLGPWDLLGVALATILADRWRRFLRSEQPPPSPHVGEEPKAG
jgi:hypothetical protein